MRKSGFSEEQIIKMLKGGRSRADRKDLCRDRGVSQETFYRWRRKLGGMEVSDARRLRQLDDGNRKLKRLVADLTLDKEALKDALGSRISSRLEHFYAVAGTPRACVVVQLQGMYETRALARRPAILHH